MQMDLKGSFACAKVSTPCERTAGFVCVYERVWGVKEEPVEGRYVNVDALGVWTQM